MPNSRSQHVAAMMAKLSEIKSDLQGLHSMNGTFSKEKIREIELAISHIESALHQQGH